MAESISGCIVDGCTRPLFNKKHGLCHTHYVAKIRAEKKAKTDPPAAVVIIPQEVIDGMSTARSQEDWQKLGSALTPIMASIMAGSVKATAAQVSLIKDIMNRAYGKAVATQTEKTVSTGVVLLPVIGSEANSVICPKCMFEAISQLQQDTTRDLAVKVLRELLEKLLAFDKATSTVVS